jgi:hypothetical protein
MNIVELLKKNEVIIKLGQWSVSRPDYFLHHVLPQYADDGHANDFTMQARQSRYEAELTPEGLAHELSLPNPVETVWGVIRERDGLDLGTLTRVREYDQRKVEWSMNATPEDVALVSAIIRATYRTIHEEQVSYLAIPPGPTRNTAVLTLIKQHHRRALREVCDGYQ